LVSLDICLQKHLGEILVFFDDAEG
jgi:hypothetical protein